MKDQIKYLFEGGTIPGEFFEDIHLAGLKVEYVETMNYGDDTQVVISGKDEIEMENLLIKWDGNRVVIEGGIW